jgi:hypothetical protein
MNMTIANDFATLDAQADVSRFAQMTPDERPAFEAWIDETMASVPDPLPSVPQDFI